MPEKFISDNYYGVNIVKKKMECNMFYEYLFIMIFMS